jgi:hypothetical protein
MLLKEFIIMMIKQNIPAKHQGILGSLLNKKYNNQYYYSVSPNIYYDEAFNRYLLNAKQIDKTAAVEYEINVYMYGIDNIRGYLKPNNVRFEKLAVTTIQPQCLK